MFSTKSHSQGSNLLKDALEELPHFPCRAERYKGPWKNPIFQQYVTEVINENLQAGLQLIEGLLVWTQHTLQYPPKSQRHFSSFENYVNYRINDFTTMYGVLKETKHGLAN